jgi:hypothetical protein
MGAPRAKGTALGLLGRRDISLTDDVGHLDLMRLLRSHIHFDLPGHNELFGALVHDSSPVAGKPLSSLYRELHGYDFEVIAITRREHVLLPHPDTILERGDRVTLIASPKVRGPLGRFLVPLKEENHALDRTP